MKQLRDDLDYHELRARQEAEAAAACTVPEAVFVHRQMAELHAVRVRELRAQRERRLLAGAQRIEQCIAR